jgi:hypothetical protein
MINILETLQFTVVESVQGINIGLVMTHSKLELARRKIKRQDRTR